MLLLVLNCSIANAQFVKKHGQLSVKGTQLVDKNRNPIVLRGVSLGWHSIWPRFYNEKVVDWLKKDFNCNIVRAAMGIEIGAHPYMKEPQFSKEKIEVVIKGAIKSDIYVIVDWHSHNINLKEAKEYFDEISKKYGKYPNVIYEIFNEPDYETWPEVKSYSEEIIKVIRANDPYNVILVGCPKWDQDVNLPAADPIKGYDNLCTPCIFMQQPIKKNLGTEPMKRSKVVCQFLSPNQQGWKLQETDRWIMLPGRNT